MVTRMSDVGMVDELVRLLAVDDLDFDRIDTLADRIRSSADATLQPVLERHLADLLDAGNWFGRDEIARLLYELCGLAALPALLRASARDLGDDQDNLSSWIVDLFHTDRAAARSAVLDCLASTEPGVRRLGVWALGFVGEEQDRPLIVEAAADADPRMRSAALGSLRIPADDAPDLVAVFEAGVRDPDRQVRIIAISQLGWQRREALIPLIASGADDPEPRVREFVAHALGRIPGRPECSRSVLEKLAGDQDARVRAAARTVLGTAGR